MFWWIWSDSKNYSDDQFDEEIGYDKFKNSNQKIDIHKKDLHIFEKNSKDSFYFAVLFGIMFKLTEQVNFSTDPKETETDISKDLFEKLKGLKDMLRLDLIISSFEQQCFHMN